MADFKCCSACGEEKPVEAFSRNRARKDGRQTYCKECTKGKAVTREPDPVAARAAQKRYYDKNRDARHAATQAWRVANPEHVSRYQRDYALRARDEVVLAYGNTRSDGGNPSRLIWRYRAHPVLRPPLLSRCHAGTTPSMWSMVRKSRSRSPQQAHLLCWNCNAARGIYGACPHERDRLEGAI